MIDRRGTAPGAVAVDDSGRLLVAGSPSYNTGGLLRYGRDGSRDTGFGLDGGLAALVHPAVFARDVLLGPDGTTLAALLYGGRFAIARVVVDEPALAATADQPRACSARITTENLSQLLSPAGGARHGRLDLELDLRRPGGVRVSAIANTGGGTAKIGASRGFYLTFGKGFAAMRVSKAAARLLRSASSAQIVVTVRDTDGGRATTTTRTMVR